MNRFRTSTLREFQSTFPVRGATLRAVDLGAIFGISIHAPRAGSDLAVDGIVGRKTWISIHAPRAGSDSPSWARYPATMHFNPRSPCGERRAKYNQSINTGIFQSTLPVRGATSCRRTCLRTSLHFNPRSPCGERHDGGIDYALNDRISIHAPRAGSDAEAGLILTQVRKFQSTLPVRGATATRLWNRTRWRSFQSTLPVRGATKYSAI